jgi:hypothetical protein
MPRTSSMLWPDGMWVMSWTRAAARRIPSSAHAEQPFGTQCPVLVDRGDQAARQVHRPERVLEAGVLRAGIDEAGGPELPHAAQPLHLRRVEEAQLLVGEVDVAVDGIPDDRVASALAHRGDRIRCAARVLDRGAVAYIRLVDVAAATGRLKRAYDAPSRAPAASGTSCGRCRRIRRCSTPRWASTSR